MAVNARYRGMESPRNPIVDKGLWGVTRGDNGNLNLDKMSYVQIVTSSLGGLFVIIPRQSSLLLLKP